MVFTLWYNKLDALRSLQLGQTFKKDLRDCLKFRFVLKLGCQLSCYRLDIQVQFYIKEKLMKLLKTIFFKLELNTAGLNLLDKNIMCRIY